MPCKIEQRTWRASAAAAETDILQAESLGSMSLTGNWMKRIQDSLKDCVSFQGGNLQEGTVTCHVRVMWYGEIDKRTSFIRVILRVHER